MGVSATARERNLGAPSRSLARQPLLWAAATALVGAAVGLAGVSRLAAWLGDPYGSTPGQKASGSARKSAP